MTVRPFDAVIFDMDGTLVDSEPMTRVVVDRLLAQHGLPPEAVDDRDLHGVTWAAIADLLGGLHPGLQACSADSLAADWLGLWRAEPPATVPGIEAALVALTASGRPVALATSSHRNAADALVERPVFASVFDVITTAEDIERSKPDPQIFELAAARLGVAPDRCLVFEDSLAGLTGARAAGMGCVAVLLRSADRVRARDLSDLAVEDFTQLPSGFFGPPQQT